MGWSWSSKSVGPLVGLLQLEVIEAEASSVRIYILLKREKERCIVSGVWTRNQGNKEATIISYHRGDRLQQCL
jgi:hypothetical protein